MTRAYTAEHTHTHRQTLKRNTKKDARRLLELLHRLDRRGRWNLVCRRDMPAEVISVVCALRKVIAAAFTILTDGPLMFDRTQHVWYNWAGECVARRAAVVAPQRFVVIS